ncbi:cytochrome P450 3A8-like isoform X1 [Dermacentor variabilis]|uniref:cytochrome P450 3A8-like isoform X1 n=2 Tax=Dermacentor variabilis TaxID=34621 RepID=UPI003F5B31EF
MERFGNVDWVLLAVFVCVLLYLYAARNRNYWKNQNVPYEPFSLILGPAMRRLLKPMPLIDYERYRKLGRLFGIYEGGKPVLVVAEPDLIKQVLTKDFASVSDRLPASFFDPIVDNMMGAASGEHWKKIRTTASPAFTTGKLRKMNDLVLECVKNTSKHLRHAGDKKKDVDIKQFFGDYGLDIIARCAFGTKLDSHSDSSNQFVTNANKAFAAEWSLPFVISKLFPGVAGALKIGPLNSAIFQYFKTFSTNIMENRKKKNQRHEDFLQLMMDAQEGTLTDSPETSTNREATMFDLDSKMSIGSSPARNVLSEDEALAQCVLFFLAAYDALSTVLSCAAYQLALNPAIQDKLRREADECFATHGEDMNWDIVSKLPYLNSVISETMRLYTPAVRLDRTTVEDYVLGDAKIKVPKGCAVIVPVYALHRDPEFFPNPEVFDPDRFSDANIASIKPYSYLPFGAGPRNCIGMRFGLQVVKFGILYAIRAVEFVRTEKTKVPLQFETAAVSVLKIKDVTIGIRSRAQ